MTIQVEKLPYGIGRFTGRWILLIAGLLALIGLGAYAYSRQFVEGLGVTGMRDIGTMAGSPWGLYIAFDVYFVGVSFAGMAVAALIRLLGLKQLKPIARMAEALTVISLLLGAFTIIADVGQPVRAFVNLFRYARPQSPFFGTFTLVVAGYLFGSLVYLYLDGRRDAAVLARVSGPLQGFYRLWAAGYRDTPAERERRSRSSFWLAIAILPLLVTAHSTLGFVFGLQVGRPGWFSGLQAPSFVILAGASGIGLLAVIAAILRQVLALEDELDVDIFKWLGRFLMVMIAVYLYFMIVEWLTTTYAAHHHEIKITTALLTGEFAWLYWGVLVTLSIALGALFLPYLPAPSGLQLPAYRPVYARATGLVALVAAVMMVVLTVPGTDQAALTIAPTVAQWLPWMLLVLLGLFGLTIFPLVRRSIIAGSVVSGVLVNVAAIAKRFLIVVPSQTHGPLLPYPTGSYSPTWVEYSIILGLFALGTLLYIIFVKVFPIMEVREPIEGGF